MDKLTGLVLIFDEVRGGGAGRDGKGLALLCHLEEKVVGDEFCVRTQVILVSHKLAIS